MFNMKDFIKVVYRTWVSVFFLSDYTRTLQIRAN